MSARGLDCNAWRTRSAFLELGARWYFWIALVMTGACAFGRFA